MSSDLKFSSEFIIPNWAMRLNRSHPDIVRDWVWFIQFISIMSLVVFCALCLFYSIIYYDITGGLITKASKNGTMAILSVNVFIKYFVLLKYQKSFKELIAMVDRDYELAKEFSREEKDIVMKYAKRGINACWLYLLIGTAVSALFPGKALLLTAHSYWKKENKLVPLFDITFPQYLDAKKEEPPLFWTIFMIEFCFGLCCNTIFVGFDPVVPIFLLHSCGQIDVLKKRVLNIFTDKSSPVQVRSELRLVVIKFQQICNFVEWIKVNYAFVYEFIMKTSTVLLPFSAAQVFESLQHGSFNVEFVAFCIGALVHFGIPCYYSDLLKEKGESFREAIYSCGWESHPDPKTRKMLLIMLTRASRPLVLNTIFYDICLDSFAVMCKDAYAIFNIMTAAMK